MYKSRKLKKKIPWLKKKIPPNYVQIFLNLQLELHFDKAILSYKYI